MKFVGTRLLDTGDTLGDFLIEPDKEFVIGWAVNTETSDLSEIHDEWSASHHKNFVTLTSDGNPAWNTFVSEAESGATSIGLSLATMLLAFIQI